jgi:hypothetical protein
MSAGPLDPGAPPELVFQLRREEGDPEAYTVRFQLTVGEGYLRLPGPWGQAPRAQPAGAASGLSLDELADVHLVYRPRRVDGWRQLALCPHGVAPVAAVPAGVWTDAAALAAPPPDPAGESSELVFEPLLHDTTDVGAARPPPADGQRTDLNLAPPAAAEPGPAGPGWQRPSASLVRSLTRRVREQEAEIRGLRARVAELEAALGRASR